jgi:hypothetical protein
MPTFNLPLPDGGTQPVEAGNYAEASAKLERYLATVGGNYPKPGGTPSVSQENQVPFMQKMEEGLRAGTDAEKIAFYRQKYPGAEVAPAGDAGLEILVPGQPAMYTNRPGADMGDLARGIGSVGPSMIGAAAPGYLPGMALAAGGELAREGLQSFTGTQRETPKEIGMNVAGAAGAEGLGRGLGAAVKYGVNRALGRTASKQLSKEELIGYQKAVTEGIDLPDFMKYQLTDSPVWQQWYAQMGQLNPEMKAKQILQARELIGSMKNELGQLGGRQDRAAQEALAEAYEGRLRGLQPPSLYGAGEALFQAARGGVSTRNKAMAREYANLDQIAQKENPVFDISQAQAAAKQRMTLGMATDEESARQAQALIDQGVNVDPATFQAYINVAPTQEAKLARLNTLLANLKPEQTNWKVLKELRTQAGALREWSPNEKVGANKAQATAIFGDLTEGLQPKGSPKFSNAWKQANQTAKRYYEAKDYQTIQEILAAPQAGQQEALADALASNPTAFGRSVMSVMADAGDDVRRNAADNLSAMIAHSKDPVGTLDAFKAKAPEAYRWLAPDKPAEANLMQWTRDVQDLRNGPLADAWKAGEEQAGFALKSLESKAGTPRTTQAFMAQVPPGEGQTAYRVAVGEKIMNGAIKEKDGGLVIDAKRMTENIEKVKTAGWWDEVLTDRERAIWSAYRDYARRTKSKSSSGAGLVIAGLIGKLRDPQHALPAFAEIRAARYLSEVSTRAVGVENLLKQNLDPGKSPFTSSAFNQVGGAFAQSLREAARQNELTKQAREALSTQPVQQPVPSAQ